MWADINQPTPLELDVLEKAKYVFPAGHTRNSPDMGVRAGNSAEKHELADSLVHLRVCRPLFIDHPSKLSPPVHLVRERDESLLAQ